MILLPSSFPIPKILKVSNHSFSLIDRCPTTNRTTSTSQSQSVTKSLRPVRIGVCCFSRIIFFIFLFTTQSSGLLIQKDFSTSFS